MLTDTELITRLNGSEGSFMERKTSFHAEEVKEALVAFANSLPENQEAVLFIGVAPDGTTPGVECADKLQIKITRLAEESCYPPVPCKPTVLKYKGVEVVAAVVQHSKQQPHFVGHAFVRVGSETKKASPEKMEELIASRSEKARRILREKTQLVTTLWKSISDKPTTETVIRHMMSRSGGHPSSLVGKQWQREVKRECRIESCDSHVVRLLEISTGLHLAASLENVKIDYDETKYRMKLVIDER